MSRPDATTEHIADLTVGALLAVAVLGAALVAGAELGARLFGSGTWLRLDVGDGLHAALRLARHVDDPRLAWPPRARRGLPGPVAYWACTAAVLGIVGTFVVAAVQLVTRRRVGPVRRRRLGVDPIARFGRRRDLTPLFVRGPVDGRLTLGRVGRRLVATENGSATGRRRRSRARHGDRCAVAVIGPTRCGKTANTVSGVLDWQGPAILSSVKNDLLGATIGWRQRLGEVRVFDPTGTTRERCAGWSPLRDASTISGAQRAARALVDSGPRSGAEDLDFFLALGEQLLWPILYLAAVSDHTMGDVARWVLLQDRPTDQGPGELLLILERELDTLKLDRRRAATAAQTALTGTWELDERTCSSAYATVQTLVRPWTDPGVAAAATSQDIDLRWLLSGNNTLYLCAPLHEQARLASVFGGLLGDLVQQAYETVARDNRPLTPTLLVMDEAGNTPTRWLPAVASTCAGIGLLLVTVWQSKAQIDAAYRRLADSVLTNHGTKIVFAGVSDPATGEYVSRLLGDEEVLRRSRSTDPAGGHTSIGESTHATALVPRNLLRQIRPGEALLLHGTLPPAHLHARPYYVDRHLLARSRTPTQRPGATEP